MVYNDAPRPSDHRIPTTNVYENVFYDNESVTFPSITGTANVTYEVRDYYGNVVASGTLTGSSLDLGVMPLGFYKLFLPRVTPIVAPYLNAGGEATFAVVRSTSPLKARPAVGTAGASSDQLGNGFDMPMRGMCGVGPVRHQIRLDATNYAGDKAGALADIAYENSNRNNDTARPHRQFVAFPDYDNTSSTQNTNLTNAVQACVAAGVIWFEGKNEPAATVNDPTGANLTQFTTFANTVHAASASAKVMGPCPIDLSGDWNSASGGQAHWIWSLLNAAPDKSIVDVISYHNYNNGQGDLAQMRRSLQTLTDLLTNLGLQSRPRACTEFGSAFAASNAVGDHRQQAKNIMLDLHVSEQYGVPKENTYYFYDRSHGFWGFSSWWIHCETIAMPTALVPLFRVWAEELWGKAYSARLNFGSEDDMWIGSRFTGSDGSSVIALQSSGHIGNINLSVTGATTVTTVDPWGNLTTRAVVNGVVAVPVSEIPSYVRIPNGVSANTVPANWGVETFRSQFSTASASGTASGSPALVIDGNVNGLTADWIGTTFPAWWRVDFPKLTRFNRVTVFCGNPVNGNCTLTDFDIQVLQGGVWNTVATVTESLPQKLWTSYKSAGATYIEVYWARRNQWSIRFDSAVAANAIRIYIRSTSYGGVPSPESYNQNPGAGVGNQIGLSGPQVPQLREVACYLNEYDLAGKNTPNAPLLAIV